MRLKELKYIEPGYSIEGLYFDYVGLIVGKNSVGKSRAVNVIMRLWQIILQQYKLRETDFFEYDVVFADKEVDIHYRFVCQAGEVFMEYMDDSYSHYLDRQCGTTNFYGENICPPKNQLCINVRRDTVKYPEVEKIIHWAEQSQAIYFGQLNYSYDDPSFGIVSMFEKLNKAQRADVIKMMSDMGYNIEDIKVGEICPSLKLLLINEKDVLRVLRFEELSDAMRKTLFLTVMINYFAADAKEARTIIIDDLCEGLDYQRAVTIGTMIYEFCIKHGIQLIATTNNNFLMNAINLNYWNILKREGGKVTAINMHNAKQTFVDFKSKDLENSKLLFP